jgi:glycosyltransferase involved in cell wall biosynthesis
MPLGGAPIGADVRSPTLDELPPPPSGKIGWPWTADAPSSPERGVDTARWPRVSVVTPSYNQGRFIEETIRSVLLQGYPNLEYLILDGGSTDETLSVIHRYEPWLSYWVSEPDGGQTNAINKGWERATGEILAYLNTDDFYMPGAIATAAAQFRPDVGMVYGTARLIDESGRELSPWLARPFDLETMLVQGSIVPQPATFFSQPVVRRLGYLNEQRHMIMDYELCIRIGMEFPTVCVPDTIASFRTHAQSKTWRQFELMAKELIDFVMSFQPTGLSDREWKRIRSSTLSRVHYEWAFEYLARGQRGPKALGQLLQSIRLYPPFALRRPMLTGHIVKEVLAGLLRPGAERS